MWLFCFWNTSIFPEDCLPMVGCILGSHQKLQISVDFVIKKTEKWPLLTSTCSHKQGFTSGPTDIWSWWTIMPPEKLILICYLFYLFYGGVTSQKCPVMVDVEWVGKRQVNFQSKRVQKRQSSSYHLQSPVVSFHHMLCSLLLTLRSCYLSCSHTPRTQGLNTHRVRKYFLITWCMKHHIHSIKIVTYTQPPFINC